MGLCGSGALGRTGHGVLGGRYAKRCRTAQSRAVAGQHGEDAAMVASEPMVALVMVTKSLGSVSLTISSHLRPKAMRVSVSAGRSGREGCVPAAQSRRMPERALGLLLTSGGWWVGLGSKAAHDSKGGNTLEACGRRGGWRVYLWH